jgi:hypothetical protein
MTYTTQELIEILDRELKANWKGQRLVLSSEERINDPVVSKLLDMEKVSKVFAYQDFRRQIHQYQKQHQVSGIIWRECSFRNQVIRYPEVYNQLIPIEGDKAILIQAKNSIIEFWRKTTVKMKYWLVNAPGSSKPQQQDYASSYHQQISAEYVDKLINQTEWAEIDAACQEIYLGLCWGDPLEYRYQWAKPKSGCDRIIASNTKPSSIKI